MPEPLLHEPASVFMIIMAIVFIAPLLSKRVNLPGIIGLILGGMLIGRNVLNLLQTGQTIELFAAVGLIYLMFDAGLDIDLDQFKRVRGKALVFASISYLLPQLAGIGLGRWFGLSWIGAVLLGATVSSQTLIAYPILSRLGIIRNEAIAVTVGATIFTDIASLLVLAVVTESQAGELSFMLLARLIGLTLIYAAILLLAVPRFAKLFFRHFGRDIVKFQFALVVLFIAAVLAEQIGMHTIVGAFLAGLAINAALSRHSKVVGQVHFLGESLFIPLFLMTVGMRLDPIATVQAPRTLLLGTGLVIAIYATKLLAAFLTGQLYGYARREVIAMWGLSQAQAAATLAAALVGTEADILPESVLNAAIMTVLLTSVTSPILVERFGEKLQPAEKELAKRPPFKRILVPVHDSDIPNHLLNLAAILAHTSEGTVLLLNMAEEKSTLDGKQEQVDKEGLQYPEVELEFLRRIEASPAEGILHEAKEQNASMILVNWPQQGEGEQSVLGPLLEQVMWNTEVPLLAARIETPVEALDRVVLVIASHTVGVKLSSEAVDLVSAMAEGLDVPLLVLATSHYMEGLQEQLDVSDKERQLVELGDEAIGQITERVSEHDLVVISAMGSRQRFGTGEGQVPDALLGGLKGPLTVLRHP